jgi:putative flippase GtrA
MSFRSQFWQIVRFLVAGSIGLALYFFMLYALTDWLKIWYILSAIIASLANFLVNFILQKFWTFKNREKKDVPRQIRNYFILGVATFLSNLLGLYLLVEYAHLYYLIAQALVTVVQTFFSFIFTRRIFAS